MEGESFMEKLLILLDWFGTVCLIYVIYKLVIIGKDIIIKELGRNR